MDRMVLLTQLEGVERDGERVAGRMGGKVQALLGVPGRWKGDFGHVTAAAAVVVSVTHFVCIWFIVVVVVVVVVIVSSFSSLLWRLVALYDLIACLRAPAVGEMIRPNSITNVVAERLTIYERYVEKKTLKNVVRSLHPRNRENFLWKS